MRFYHTELLGWPSFWRTFLWLRVRLRTCHCICLQLSVDGIDELLFENILSVLVELMFLAEIAGQLLC